MISHDHRLIFIHVPKCAGRSIADAFNQRFDHFTTWYYKSDYPAFWRTYESFAIVRHPLDRLVSIYHYIKEHRRHKNESIGFYGQMPNFKTWLSVNIEAYQGKFNITSAEGMRGSDGDIGSSFWFSPQYLRILDVKKIFYFEDGMKPVEDYIYKLTGVNLKVDHINGSKREPWESYYDRRLLEKCLYFAPLVDDFIKLNNLNYGWNI